ncbi:MAG: response regulator transcription factor [Rhodocyclaceae bacterium]|nr:response regulator transcription factor [Rhodocyclaceae bacterium]
MLKLLVIEDHALVREGLLQTVCELEPDTQAIGASEAGTALSLLEANNDVDLILLDLMLPHLNGMALLTVLRKRFPDVPVVILSAMEDNETVRRAIGRGASGFVPKSSTSAALLSALRQVLAGEIYLPPQYQEGVPGRRRRGLAERFGLTKSQMSVLELMVEGKTNRQIAELLGLTEGTVKIHVSAIFKVLNVTNRPQALLAVGKLQLRG